MKTSQPQRNLWLGGLVLFLAMAALGWTIGQGGSDAAEEEKADSLTKSDHRRSGSAVRRARANAASARETVRSISLGVSSEQRLRSTIELANSLSPQAFADWMDGGWFDFRSGFELTLFRRILEERWRAEDPEGFVAWCLEEGEQGPSWATSKPKGAALPILTDWALNDPNRLQAFFAKYPDDQLEAQLISQLAKDNPEVALAHLTRIAKRNSANIYGLSSAIKELAQNAPHLVESVLAELPTSLRFQAESALVGERLKTSFDSEIRALFARPDGWTLFSGASSGVEGLDKMLLAELDKLPASWRGELAKNYHQFVWNGDAEAWFRADFEGAGFTEEQIRRLRTGALSALTSRKPERALELIARSGFDEKDRYSAISSVFQRAGSNPELAEKWMAMLPSEADRLFAREVLDQQSQTPTVSGSVTHTPESLLEALGESEGDRQSSRQLAYAMRRWSADEFSQLTGEFPDLPDSQKDQIAALMLQNSSLIENTVGKSLAGEAIRHQISRELESVESGGPAEGNGVDSSLTDRNLIRHASTMAVDWVQQDAKAASAWVDSLPESDTKLWVQRNMATTWAQYDPAAMQEWLGTLPAERQTEVRKYLNNPNGQ